MTRQHWLKTEDCNLDDLLRVLDDHTDPSDYPTAARIEQEVVVYDSGSVREALAAGRGGEIQEEIYRALADGPGIVVLTGAFEDDVVDRATDAFNDLILQQREDGIKSGDHFAKPGANDRVWNALEKLAVEHPDVFVDYYDNDMLALAATSWLGPGYQVTSQLNVVNPGGAGQTVHRDYHLGFQSPDVSSQFASPIHKMSAMLTLQGAVAHVDMPVESGPTLYLPHSQKYELGYLAYWRPEFQDYFVAHHIQLPLAKGDAVFFNPALFHAAGTNRTNDIRRMANLLQVSSPFGRAMETVDRRRMSEALYPTLLDRLESGLTQERVDRVVAASAEGYAFPTNLDRDQPVDGMAPPTQADLVRDALAQRMTSEQLGKTLAGLEDRQQTR
ncbi:phytanoyl-CoA dioxygenase family protein [Arsenicicoccus piscis]|uniref:Phytanoyl-CoA dioxygenase n=1 Tax=Arsenicicoccus piscis TaxID=673954 RepID=A0ABQ6HU01_9MICO|nr:phytanoyl-CoA dioxygenase family protein [Arsenicicoccus piscis]MCH8627470.1 phytanoyl-CoA dioxygenase family protein [Arsenicicoccus piscis]GMA21637.1 phytanoyl-CoA dioxygenase [Arsenicicoccus piscis]